MATYVVCISYTDLAEGEEDREELVGPFRSMAAASAFADRLTAHMPSDPNHHALIHVRARVIQPALIRPYVRMAHSFIEECNQAPESWAY